jgi:hypothetical protein
MRVADGAFRTKTDKNGAEYYLHRLAGGPRLGADVPLRPAAEGARAEAGFLHAVYSDLLALLTLAAGHRDNLRGRDLTDEQIDRRGYRTLPVQGRARLAAKLREQFGGKVLSVPGLVVKQGKNGPYLSIAGAAGLLVPVRDPAGRVLALKVRRDDGGPGSRYSYVSSTKHGGPGPGSPVHVPLGVTAPCPCVRVTEGELKSDVATSRSDLPTISIAGVGNWLAAVEAVRELEAKTVRLAFDMDAPDKPQVARALAAFAEALGAQGVAVELERWPAEHKGIDDALAAGAAIEVLTGDAARQAVAYTLAEATAAEQPQEPSPVDRIADVLAEGGAEALFRDRDLLAALARLAEDDPAEFACHRARLAGAGVRLRDLDRALAPLRQEVRRDRPAPDAVGCYRVSGGRIVRDVLTRDGPVEVPLTNWSGRIVEEIVHDDGAERRIVFAVEGALADGTPLPPAEVPADQFAFMRWPVASWGTRAVVLAGASTADHVRVALQLLSGDVPRRVVFGHTGWREVTGEWVYLHAGGAIGKDGPVTGVAVSLPDALAGFRLPDPPAGAELAQAVRASLGMLNGLAPDRIAVPVQAAVCRAVLGPTDFSMHLSGPTGNFKTEFVTLSQQHFGPGMDARNLPGSWSSTGNALEGMAFAAKDTLMVVDDFAPTGSTSDVQRFHREADRLLRAQGNRAGRQRMRPDGTLRPVKPPRGLIVSTGEDVPRGQSLRSRMLVIEVSPGDVRVNRLTECQRDAAAGLYAQALAGFVCWLALRYESLRCRLGQEAADLRDKVRGESQHARTPGIIAELAVGMRYFLDYAQEVGAVTAAERDALARRCWAALKEAAAAQTKHVEAAEPTAQFLRLLSGALASGRAHIAGPDGLKPSQPETLGWRCNENCANGDGAWVPLGRRIGWADDPNLYLEPEASYAAAQEMARDQGDGLSVAPRTLRKRLHERGLLASVDAEREVLTIRKTLEGKRREVMHLHIVSLSAEKPDQPDQGRSQPQGNGQVCGQVAGHVLPDPTSNPTTKPDQNNAENGQVVGLVGSEAAGEAHTEPKTMVPRGKPRRGTI